jgi:hypothetical protein
MHHLTRFLTWLCVAVAILAIGSFVLAEWQLLLFALGVSTLVAWVIGLFRPRGENRGNRPSRRLPLPIQRLLHRPGPLRVLPGALDLFALEVAHLAGDVDAEGA